LRRGIHAGDGFEVRGVWAVGLVVVVVVLVVVVFLVV